MWTIKMRAYTSKCQNNGRLYWLNENSGQKAEFGLVCSISCSIKVENWASCPSRLVNVKMFLIKCFFSFDDLFLFPAGIMIALLLFWKVFKINCMYLFLKIILIPLNLYILPLHYCLNWCWYFVCWYCCCSAIRKLCFISQEFNLK